MNTSDFYIPQIPNTQESNNIRMNIKYFYKTNLSLVLLLIFLIFVSLNPFTRYGITLIGLASIVYIYWQECVALKKQLQNQTEVLLYYLGNRRKEIISYKAYQYTESLIYNALSALISLILIIASMFTDDDNAYTFPVATILTIAVIYTVLFSINMIHAKNNNKNHINTIIQKQLTRAELDRLVHAVETSNFEAQDFRDDAVPILAAYYQKHT